MRFDVASCGPAPAASVEDGTVLNPHFADLSQAVPDRIRHGISAVHDPELLAELIERRIVLDVCPTSNIRLGYATERDHPITQLAVAGVLCSVSTDDPAMFFTDLSREYALAAELGVTEQAAWEAGLAGALCDERTRSRLQGM